MKNTEVLVPELDLYLAASMRPSAELSDLLKSFGIDTEAMARARARADRAGVTDFRTTSCQLIVRHFGAPVEASPQRLVYPLVVWPQHLFLWRTIASGCMAHEGFVLRERSPMPSWTPLTLKALRDVL